LPIKALLHVDSQRVQRFFAARKPLDAFRVDRLSIDPPNRSALKQ
jgi:hypothetical protein